MLEIGGVQLLAIILIIAFFFIVFHVISYNWEMKVYESRKKAAEEHFISEVLDLAREQEEVLFTEKIDVVTREHENADSLPGHRISILQPGISASEKVLSEK